MRCCCRRCRTWMAHLPQYFLYIVLLSLLLDIYAIYSFFYVLNFAFLPYIIAQPTPNPHHRSFARSFHFPYNIILRSHLILWINSVLAWAFRYIYVYISKQTTYYTPILICVTRENFLFFIIFYSMFGIEQHGTKNRQQWWMKWKWKIVSWMLASYIIWHKISIIVLFSF